MLNSNAWNHLSVCKQMIDIKCLKPFNFVQTNDKYQIKFLVLKSNTWNHLAVSKQKINIDIIIGVRLEYLKHYDYMQTNRYYQIVIFTLNHVTVYK